MIYLIIDSSLNLQAISPATKQALSILDRHQDILKCEKER